MKIFRVLVIASLCAGLIVSGLAAFGPGPTTTDAETGAWIPGQAAADVLKSSAGADGAFLAAGLLKSSYDKSTDLSNILVYPEDNLLVLKLTGTQIRQALERSVSLYPQPNTSFLQLSGFEVTFSKTAPVGKRIIAVSINNQPLNNSQSYNVAMPSSLGHGGLGYFRIWDNSNITKTLPGSVESFLKGKPYASSAPHWSVSG